MNPEYGARYAELHQSHWWWRAREAYLLGILDRTVGTGAAVDILDFGCGNGLFFPALSRYGTPWGIETDTDLLDPAGPWRSRIRTEPLAANAHEADRYGLILALDVLEHIADPAPIVAELARRLRPGGWFVATVPAFQELWTAHDDLNYHVRRYRIGEIEDLIAQPGLRIVESRYLFVWLAILKALVALKERILAPVPRPPTIPWRPINQFLFHASRVEQRLCGTRHPLFGSSALVVARKPL